MVGLNSYKLVQFLKEYINHEQKEIPIIIYSCIAQKWLHKLRFEYKKVCKDMFVDGHE